MDFIKTVANQAGTGIEYPCNSGDGSVLACITTLDSIATLMVIDAEERESSVDLSRDSVAALVGQLTSWLARQEK